MGRTGSLFKEIDIANFTTQSRKDRFPDPENQYGSSTAENILQFAAIANDGSQSTETYTGPPHIGLWRMNLVALSQNYNMYFVASRDKLHCYIPRDLKQTLPSRPDLIIELPQSEEGVVTGGFIDELHPHSVNHLIVGNLGDLEILLMACDDGDVLAFYTHRIRDELARSDVYTRVRDIRPFFHQNVGITAWGLAIHQKSRLIAVSSNEREVSIFVHGYSENAEGEELQDCADDRNFPPLEELDNPPTSFRDRQQNYRMVLPVKLGDNIPAIDFVNDAVGEAEKIIAVDIHGLGWLIDPWTYEQEVISSMYRNATDGRTPFRGWGILSLSLQDFKPTASIHEALGLHQMRNVLNRIPVSKKAYQGCFFDATPPPQRSLLISGRWYNQKPGVLTFEGEDEEDGSRNPIYESTPSSSLTSGSASTLTQLPNSGSDNPTVKSARQENTSRERNVARNSDDTSAVSRKHKSDKEANDQKKLDHLLQMARNGQRDTDLVWLLLRLPTTLRSHIRSWQDLISRGHAFKYLDRNGIIPMTAASLHREEKKSLDPPRIILRAYAHDIELFSLPRGEAPHIQMTQPLHLRDGHRFNDLHRLNLVALIPELNLVVVGSQSGRVCLLTLTKLIDPDGVLPPFISFRLDQILPTMKQVYPDCPLLGMAVSPLQSGARREGRPDGSALGRRWRLILHYYDHSILGYELGRDEDGLLLF